MKLSRRRLAAMAAATPLLARTAVSQTPPQPNPATAPDLAQTVRDANRRNAEAIAKFEVPLATEPAFRFWP